MARNGKGRARARAKGTEHETRQQLAPAVSAILKFIVLETNMTDPKLLAKMMDLPMLTVRHNMSNLMRVRKWLGNDIGNDRARDEEAQKKRKAISDEAQEALRRKVAWRGRFLGPLDPWHEKRVAQAAFAKRHSYEASGSRSWRAGAPGKCGISERSTRHGPELVAVEAAKAATGANVANEMKANDEQDIRAEVAACVADMVARVADKAGDDDRVVVSPCNEAVVAEAVATAEKQREQEQDADEAGSAVIDEAAGASALGESSTGEIAQHWCARTMPTVAVVDHPL